MSALRLGPRGERVEALSRRTFDVLVVGGGITGAAAARDAASRGLSTALVERRDWASGTSWRSTKLVHGGLRYLRQGEIRLVFESLAERARLLEAAPHLVRPLEFLFAVLPGRWVSAPLLEVGLTIYDLLAVGRGAPRHRRLSPGAALREEPLLAGARLAGAALYSDAGTDDARLTLENVLDAAGLGAVVATRIEAGAPLRDLSGAVSGMAARDLETGREIEIRARATIDATGPWSDEQRRRVDPTARPRLRLSRGAHVTVPAARLPARRAVAVPVEEGRLFFAIPSGPVTLLGTTDSDYTGAADAAGPSAADVSYILARAGEAFPGAALTPADVIATFAGLRPLRLETGKRISATSREEAIDVSPGLVEVTGGKLTTHRRMGERAVDAALPHLTRAGIRAGASRTRGRPFPGSPGARFEDFEEAFVREARASGAADPVARHLARRYGARARDVLAAATSSPGGLEPLVPGLPDCVAEVFFAVREEDARGCADVLVRRTHLFWQAAGQGMEALPVVGRVLAGELGRSAADVEASAKEYAADVERSRRAASGAGTAS